jgi:UDP-glucose 4-epimerase
MGSIPKFIYLGSLTEFGYETLNPIQDDAPVKPETFYDAAKIATETYLEQFHNEGWIQQLLILRLGNLYGLNSGNFKNHRGFLDKSIALATQGTPLRCFGTGKYLRDFIHVEDVLEIVVKAALEGNIEKSEKVQLNVATGIGTSIIDALNSINLGLLDLGKPSVEIQFFDFPADSYRIETRSHFADISGASRRFNWKPRVSFYEGVHASLQVCLAANQES